MSARRHVIRPLVAVASLLAGLAAVVTSAPAAHAAEPPSYSAPTCPRTGVSLVGADPVDNRTLYVPRMSAPKAGGVERWDLKYDPWLCNRTDTLYKYVDIKAEFLNLAGTVTKTISDRLWRRYYPQNGDSYLNYYWLPKKTATAVGGFWRYNEPSDNFNPIGFDTPIPSKIRMTFTLKPEDTSTTGVITKVLTYQVAVQNSPTFFFPLSQDDLPAGAYYFQDYHDDWNWHNRYALDIAAHRWDPALGTAGEWTDYKAPDLANPSNPINDHHNPESWVMWGAEVRAMSDGEVVACVRGAPDNDPYIIDGDTDVDIRDHHQVAKYPGGNFVWIRTGSETQVYAHLQQNSIPYKLCPHNDNKEYRVANPFIDAPGDVKYQVHAGDYLGLVGNSGNTSNPHTHVESIRGTAEIWGGTLADCSVAPENLPRSCTDAEYDFGSDSRPMNFVNVDVQPHILTNWQDVTPGDWVPLTSPRVLPYRTEIRPNTCDYLPTVYVGDKEVVHVGTSPGCWSQEYNAMRQAGFRPIHYDSTPRTLLGSITTESITTVWRPDDGTPWAMLLGLDAAGLTAAEAKYPSANGWRYLNLQSYTVGGVVRYAAIWVHQPGAKQYRKSGMSLATFSSTFTTKTSEGYRMVDYSVVATNRGGLQYTGLWVYAPGINNYVVKDVAAADYQAEFDTQTAAGRMPVSLDGFTSLGSPYLATIWYGGQGATWTAQHGLTSSQADFGESLNVANGRYARAFTEYGTSTHQFAAVWRAAPNTAITAGPTGLISRPAVFSFTSPTDPLATFECKVGAAPYTACTSPKTYSLTTSGSHTLFVRARDFQGMYDPTPATRTWSTP